MGVAAELLFSSDIQHQTDMHALQFLGAVLLGRGVTDTIKSGIVDQDSFRDTPDVFMYGMFCALIASALWLMVATMLELPVSTAHSLFGCDSYLEIVLRVCPMWCRFTSSRYVSVSVFFL